jgi:two-component system, response regulator YesN
MEVSMKILIVDDELLVRIGIKSCIEWNKYGMEVVGEASDGVEALQLIKILCPDVILLDIKMPNMDGLEVMAKIKEENIQCKVIILSGFDDIFHVKEAMKLGALDYFHKPCMNPKDVIDLLLSTKQQVEKEKLRKNHQSSEEKAALNYINQKPKDAFLEELLEGHAFSDLEFKQKSNEYGISFENSYFNCMVFSVKELDDVKKRYEDGDISRLQSSVLNIVRGVFPKEHGIEVLSVDRNTFAMIAGMKGVISERKVMDSIEETIKCIMDAMTQFLNIDIILGVSDVHVTFKEIGRAYEEAVKAHKYKFYYNLKSVIYYRDLKKGIKEDTITQVDGIIERLKGFLTKSEYSKFTEALQELISLIRDEPCLTEEDVKKLFNAFLFLIREGKASFEEMELINKCETLQKLYKTWETIVKDQFNEKQFSKQYQTCSFLVKGILAYIDEKYNQDITLNSVAEHFNVTPNYVSRVFKEETKETLFNYLNLVRIEKAKELLKETGVKIYEIGFKVGFKSSVHFNIVFNKLTGLSPTQYRDKL